MTSQSYPWNRAHPGTGGGKLANAGITSEIVAIDAARELAASREFARDVRRGLGHARLKTLPCRYFYDTIGSILFEAIANLPEYGLAAADERLLKAHSRAMIETAAGDRPIGMVAELGSGSGRKTRHLLVECGRHGPVRYCPIEISGFALQRCRSELDGLQGLEWNPIAADYLEGLAAVARLRNETASAQDRPLLLLFLGSSYGNFPSGEGLEFLRNVRAQLQAGDSLLLGLDLVKPIGDLLAAYDDPCGVTAAFNLNLLARINRELGADFNLRHFRHYVRYDDSLKRVEMHLLSLRRQHAAIPGADCELLLEAGETIWTESCHKFLAGDVDSLATATGFACRRQWIDATWGFCESLLVAQ